MKVSDLTGALLNYWVARAEGRKLEQRPVPLGAPGEMEWFVSNDTGDFMFELAHYGPSTNWAAGGPLLEREKIAVWAAEDCWLAIPPMTEGMSYYDHKLGVLDSDRYQAIEGPTPLVAGLRAYLTSYYGEQVPDEPGVPA